MRRVASSTTQSLLVAFRALARAMGERQSGRPDWLDLEALNGLWLPLPAAGTPPRLGVAVRDGIPLRALPASWRLPGMAEPLRIERCRAPRAVAHWAPSLRPRSRPTMVGAAGALMRANEAAGPSYLLTCAHVALPSLEGRAGALVDLTHANAVGLASVMDWRPALEAGPAHSTIDAALLAIDDALLNSLRRDATLLPTGLGEAPYIDQPVSVRSHRATLDGKLKVHWSGPVDVPGLTPGQTDYFLDEAIGYRAATRPGDSGSAIWDEQHRLMGLHIAGLDGVGAGEPDALYGPIRPVLNTFRVTPWLRNGNTAPAEIARGPAVTVTPTRRGSAPSAPGAGGRLLSERDIVACTLWGEARNQGEEGMRAVACVIRNRLKARYRRCTTASAVCLDPWQFSCWLKNDPNQARMLAAAHQPDAQFLVAQTLAAELLQNTLTDITVGARHYYAVTLRQPPRWALGKHPCVVIGDHLFFNDVD